MVVRGMACRAGWSRCQRSSGTYAEHSRDRRRTRATATAPDMANLAQEIRYHLQHASDFFISRHGGGPGRGHGRREGVETVQKLCGSLARSQGHPIAPGRTGPTGKGGAIQITVDRKGLS